MPSFPYRTAETEFVPCNQCHGTDTETLHERDRNGLAVRTCICRRCGLIYLNPRMTARWYAEYYKSEYRLQMARFKGKRPDAYDPEKLFKKATAHGLATAARFRDWWRAGSIMEVGSSVGGVLNGLQQTLGWDVFGIEPSPVEAGEANRRGIQTANSSIETLQERLPLAGNVFCTQSLNHLLDPAFFLKWAHGQLQPGGRLVLEVMNFRHIFRQFGWIRRAIQIDHTYMFVPEVLRSFLEFGGFEVLMLEADEDRSPAELQQKQRQGLPIYHIALVAERTEAQPFTDPRKLLEQYPEVRARLAKLPNSRWRFFWQYRLRPRLRKLGLLPRD